MTRTSLVIFLAVSMAATVGCTTKNYVKQQTGRENMTIWPGACIVHATFAALDSFARSSQGSSFVELSPDKRDTLLTAIDNNQVPNLRGFFNRVRRLTLEGMFSDPYYGGNKNFAGWDLIRYPGIRLAVGPEDQKMKTLPALNHKSAYGGEHGH